MQPAEAAPGQGAPPAWSFEVPWDSISDHCELAGQGGFAYVHQATYKTHTRVALKRLQRGSPEELRREYEFMRSLPPHEHVVPLYGITIDPTNQPWLVMTLYPLDLQKLFRKETEARGPAAEGPGQALTLSRALELAWELAMGLQFLHSEGIVHRDVKPDNVLLTQDLRVKITDFGISRAPGPDGTIATEQGHGSPLWMAPELTARGKPSYTNKVDVYAWGVIFCQLISRKYDRLYELLHPELITLRPGMGAREAHAMLANLQICEPEAFLRLPGVLLSKLPAHIFHLPLALDDVTISLAKACLSPDPLDRPDMRAVVGQVDAMRDCLKKHANSPERAAPPGLTLPPPAAKPVIHPFTGEPIIIDDLFKFEPIVIPDPFAFAPTSSTGTSSRAPFGPASGNITMFGPAGLFQQDGPAVPNPNTVPGSEGSKAAQ
ncbi:hypothetical protein HYH03_012463 [Edaphochlamys debaryana]|uniref:non-specific serine/threonine protein kinase n=1 Tax=Edaphochlamys debaryana TaxID=47281 RepID=A0A836BU40_9CHLO|nr:hypothetical protein HYH03_012463 [Edaphochlamys debaryana]|eukprot:KAG2489025.1 hypothetical protein HYH03_012463 [Edaphochlamys debaryana]